MTALAPIPTPAVFVLQLVWFTVVFAVVARLVVWPWSQRLRPAHAVALWIGPQMSRVLGLGLLVDNLAPGMPMEFAIPTAIGDSTTAVLALFAFVSLRKEHRIGFVIAWACTIVGVADGLHAMVTAARLQVAGNLAAQWYVPAVNIPLMAICHVAGIFALLAARKSRNASP